MNAEFPHGGHYVLDDDHRPVPVGLGTWALWYEKNPRNRIVKQEDVGEFWVSTVFLALDHRFAGGGPPILFETMVFPKHGVRGHDLYCHRYADWETAVLGHDSVVAALRAGTLFERAKDEEGGGA